MMIYLQTTRRPYRRLRQGLILVTIIAVIVIGIIQMFSPHFFAGIFTAAARPFWRTEFAIRSGELFSVETLVNEKEQLLRHIDELRVRVDTLESVESENDELRALLGREDSSASSTFKISAFSAQKSGILAAVLRRPPLSGYDYFIIDIGEDYHLSTSSLVYVPGNVLVGRVVDVLADTAKVKLFSSSGESFPVLIGNDRIAATASGRGGGQYEAQVSRDTPVDEGDAVLGSSYADRPMGLVTAVLVDPTQPFKTVLFAPPTNPYQTRWVIVKYNAR